MNVLVFFSSLAGYQSDNTMQPTTPQNDTALFSPRVFWNEMKISVFTLDGKQLFKQSGSKMFFFFLNFQPRAALRMRLFWESAQPGENCKEFFFFFFIVNRQWTIFPWNTKALRRGPMTWCTRTESPFLRPLFYLSLFIVAHWKKALSGV